MKRFWFSPDEQRDGNEASVREEDETPCEMRKGNVWERGEAASEEGDGGDGH